MPEEELRLTRTFSTAFERRRRRIRIAVTALVILPAAIIATDYSIWHHREARLIDSLSGEMGANIGSVFDWPFGKEYRIEFTNRQFSADEWNVMLGALHRLPRSTVAGIRFRDCELTDSQLSDIERGVPRCALYIDVTDP